MTKAQRDVLKTLAGPRWRRTRLQTSPTVACDEQLYMMDVGMCRLILGKLAAWTCIDGKVSIVQRP